MRFAERLDEIGARPSIGTIADSYDNALAETIETSSQSRANGFDHPVRVIGQDGSEPQLVGCPDRR